MISRRLIEDLTRKYQSSQLNVVREYCQHLFLYYFYQKRKSEYILFKGGTALRIIYNSPRFSEDLDFTAYTISALQIETIFIDSLNDIAEIGIRTDFQEAKTTSGGYLAIARFNLFGFNPVIRIEASLRPKSKVTSEVILINSEYLPAYSIVSLAEKYLVGEKVSALLDRGKPRDFFDIYFLLRADLSIPKNTLPLNNVLRKLRGTKIDFKRELSPFLPRSHQNILKDFKGNLERELGRYT